MRFPFIQGPGTVGREDRLVRGGIALSLNLLAGFAVVMSGEWSVVAIAFLVLGLYCTATAALGRDPFYAHFGIDTRSEAEFPASSSPATWGYEPIQHVDLRDSQPAPRDDRLGHSPSGN